MISRNSLANAAARVPAIANTTTAVYITFKDGAAEPRGLSEKSLARGDVTVADIGVTIISPLARLR